MTLSQLPHGVNEQMNTMQTEKSIGRQANDQCHRHQISYTKGMHIDYVI